MAAHRQAMMAREFLREISKIVNFEMQDPRMRMVTITRVEPAPDFKTAKVYFSMLADEKVLADAQRALQDARNFVRAQLRARMKSLRYIPELMFKFDKAIEGSVRISKLIDKVAEERAAAEAARKLAEGTGEVPSGGETDGGEEEDGEEAGGPGDC
ncbi:MAG: 30S ribosome-binding factor RbfA [Planctomycetes bacterium]|nr:30S ribosome-binding factor RbfA [Planctomycetota bacterium]